MERSIFKYILRYSTRQQVILTVMAFASLPFIWWFYDLPKHIINNVIQGNSESFVLPFVDVELERVSYLFVACGALLGLIFINQSFKYVINVYRGITGERLLRRLRFDLYRRVLRFPLPTFRKTDQGELITMIANEVEPLGGFVAEAFSLLAFQGGQLLVILLFLLMQNWMMAMAAIALYPLQFYIIPKLQRRVNQLGKERVLRVRRLSTKIGETVQGVKEIHANDTSQYELSEFSTQLGGIYDVRMRIYIRKFVIKFLNNSIQQLGPFFFYSIGGYFVIKGELEIGTLVAAIAAHKDLGAPWKELLSYYQRMEDARIKYEQVTGKFSPTGMLPDSFLDDARDGAAPLGQQLTIGNLLVADEQGRAILDNIGLQLPLDKRIAVVGAGGSGKEEFVLTLARLMLPDRGTLKIGNDDLTQLPESISGRRISYVSSQCFIFNASLGDNLFYGLKHRPLQAKQRDEEDEKAHQAFVAESIAAGNSADDIEADWIDYGAAGAEDRASLHEAALQALDAVDMREDVYQFGLRGTIDPEEMPEVAAAIMSARTRLRERLADPQIAPLVEIFDRHAYNTNASVAENLLFGTPVGDGFDLEQLAENEYVLQILKDIGLEADFLDIGYQVATTMVELFADLPPDHELFQQFSFISAEALPEVQALLQRIDRHALDQLEGADRSQLIALPFRLIPARHRLGLIDDAFRDKMLKARQAFAENLPEHLQDAVAFFDLERYNAAANIQDNILFGKVAYGQAQAQERVGALIGEVIGELNLHNVIVDVGLDYDVGIGGARLSGAQRQKLGLARAVIKQPDILILFEATSALDAASQSHIMQAFLKHFEGRGLIWAVQRAAMAEAFDEVLTLHQGQIVERGAYGELAEAGGHFSNLLKAG